MIVVDAPNDDVLGKLALTIGALGNVRTESMRAWTEPEYRKLIGSL